MVTAAVLLQTDVIDLVAGWQSGSATVGNTVKVSYTVNAPSAGAVLDGVYEFAVPADPKGNKQSTNSTIGVVQLPCTSPPEGGYTITGNLAFTDACGRVDEFPFTAAQVGEPLR